MSASVIARCLHAAWSAAVPGQHARAALVAAVAGFFMVTLDATVVNVALPSIRSELGSGISGLQCVADGYTLMFAALMLSAGALADRVGAWRIFGAGLLGFVLVSAACALAARLGAWPLIIAGLVLMTAELAAIAVLAPGMPVWGVALLMVVPGLSGPLVMPSMTAVLLNTVPDQRVGAARASSTSAARRAARWLSRCSAPCWPAGLVSCRACGSACSSPPLSSWPAGRSR
jgi:MFS family permease